MKNTLLIALLTVSSLYANPQTLHFKRTQHIFRDTTGTEIVQYDSSSTASKVEEPIHDTIIDTISLTFEAHQLTVRDAEKISVIDFVSKVKTNYDLKEKSATAMSLHAEIGYRVMELQNRLFLGNVISQAGVEQAEQFFSVVADEALFGLQLDTTITLESFKIKSRKGKTTYKHNDKILTSVTYSSEKTTPEAYLALNRFMLYELTIHPQIITSIIDTKKEIQELSFSHTFMSKTTTTTLERIDASEISLEKVNLEEFTPKPLDYPKPLAAIIQNAEAQTVDAVRLTFDDYKRLIDEAYEGKQYLEMVLLTMEYNLQEGVQYSEPISRIRDIVQDEADIMNYFGALNASGTDSCVTILSRVDTTKTTRPHVLTIVKATSAMEQGKSTEAIDLYTSVLEKNPYISSVMHDIGQIYMRQYFMPRAWKLWDIAREIAPESGMLKEITKFENTLEKDFPEFY